MIFSNPSLAAMYFDECFINPPIFPGTVSTLRYLDQLHLEAIGGYLDSEELSVRIGEVLGTIARQTVVAILILTLEQSEGSKDSLRRLNKKFEQFIAKNQKEVEIALHKVGTAAQTRTSIGNFDMSINLDLEKVTIIAAQSLEHLIAGQRADVTFEEELRAMPSIRGVRFKALNLVPPSKLKVMLYEGISEMTGFLPQ